MTRQVISTGTTANDGTGDSLRSGAVKINANFLELYEKFGTGSGGIDYVLSEHLDFDSASINFENTTLPGTKTNLSAENPTVNRFVVIPDYTGNIVLDSAQQTLLNKTLDSCSYGALLINDLSADHQYKIYPSELTGNRTSRLPALTDSDTFVFENHVQYIRNKILDSDQLVNPRIEANIRTYDGNRMLFLNDLSGVGQPAVNYLSISNSSNAAQPIELVPDGTDTNMDLELSGKGLTGAVVLTKTVSFDTKASSSNTGNINDGDTFDRPAFFYTGATSATKDLQDGNHDGEVQYIVNTASFNLQVDEVVNNFSVALGASFTLAPGEAAQLIWYGSQWYRIT